MEESGRIDSGSRAAGAFEHWLLAFYPLWQWLVLIPAAAVFTVVGALAAMGMCAFGLQRQANLGVTELNGTHGRMQAGEKALPSARPRAQGVHPMRWLAVLM